MPESNEPPGRVLEGRFGSTERRPYVCFHSDVTTFLYRSFFRLL